MYDNDAVYAIKYLIEYIFCLPRFGQVRRSLNKYQNCARTVRKYCDTRSPSTKLIELKNVPL